MSTHPISSFTEAAMQSIKTMVDVNTIVGEPVSTSDGSVIIPISKVGFGFATGGAEYTTKGTIIERSDNGTNGLFGGGVGAGVSITPMGFLVVGQGQIKFIPMNNSSSPFDKLIDYLPQAMEKINALFKKTPDTLDDVAETV